MMVYGLCVVLSCLFSSEDGVENGTLLLVGGGSQVDEIMEAFIEKAGVRIKAS